MECAALRVLRREKSTHVAATYIGSTNTPVVTIARPSLQAYSQAQQFEQYTAINKALGGIRQTETANVEGETEQLT